MHFKHNFLKCKFFSPPFPIVKNFTFFFFEGFPYPRSDNLGAISLILDVLEKEMVGGEDVVT